MNRRLLAAAVAAVPLLGLALLQLPPSVLVALLVADVGVLGWAVAGYRTLAARPRLQRQRIRRPVPQRFFDPETGEILTAPPGPLQPTSQRSVTARQITAESRLDVERTDTRTEASWAVRSGLGDALRQALGVDDESDKPFRDV